MRRPRPSEAGFSLLTTVLLLAIASVAAVVVLSSVQDEQDMLRLAKQRDEARETAYGGLMEIMNDQGLSARLPEPETAGMKTAYQPSADSLFDRESLYRSQRSYQAEIRLLRVAPMVESSHNTVRAVMYEVRVDAEGPEGSAAGVEAQIYKVVSSQSGIIQPRTHGR